MRMRKCNFGIELQPAVMRLQWGRIREDAEVLRASIVWNAALTGFSGAASVRMRKSPVR